MAFGFNIPTLHILNVLIFNFERLVVEAHLI